MSVSQLPAGSDDAREFCALRTVSRNNNDMETPEFALECPWECHEIDKESDHVEPIRWFGILVPQSLKTARDSYEKAIELVIESANVEQRLKKNYRLLSKLKSIKSEFELIEE